MAAKKEHADPNAALAEEVFGGVMRLWENGHTFHVVSDRSGKPDYYELNYIGPKVERVTVAADGSITPAAPEAVEEAKS